MVCYSGDEIQGSDSGISLQSRDDSKSRSAFQRFGLQKLGLTIDKVDNNSAVVLPQDLNDLPFDMPKLRRRKIIPQQVCLTFFTFSHILIIYLLNYRMHVHQEVPHLLI